MAANYTCDLCNQVPADFMITAVINGDTIAVGAECVGAWAKAITDVLTQAEARHAPPAETAQEAPGADAGGDTDKQPPPAPKRPRRGQEPAQAAVQTAEGQEAASVDQE